MTYEDYWYGDVMMVRAYYNADLLRRKRINEELWLQGAYFCKALDSTVGNMFRQKGSQMSEYPSKPMELEYGIEEDEEEREAREEQEALYAEAYMNNMVFFGQKWGSEGV